jgi:phage baseplate assembly protein W
MANGLESVATQARSLRGLALPALRQSGGYFASKNRYDVAWGDLMRVIFTPIGSMPMNRAFGSGLWDVLFELNIEENRAEVEFQIRDAARIWTPHVLIRRVDVLSDERRNIQVKVTFGLREDQGVVERLILLPRDNIIRLVATS